MTTWTEIAPASKTWVVGAPSTNPSEYVIGDDPGGSDELRVGGGATMLDHVVLLNVKTPRLGFQQTRYASEDADSNHGVTFRGRAAGGTYANPSATGVGNVAAFSGHTTYNGTTFTGQIEIVYSTAQVVESGKRGTRMFFRTTLANATDVTTWWEISGTAGTGYASFFPWRDLLGDIGTQANRVGTVNANVVRVIGDASAAAAAKLDGFAGQPQLLGRRANGDKDAATQATSGNTLLGIFGEGYSGATYYPTAAILFSATEDVQTASHGGRIDIQTVLTGGSTLASRWYWDGSGNLLLSDDNTYQLGSDVARVKAVYTPILYSYAYGNTPNVIGRRAQGSIGSLTAAQSGNALLTISGEGYDGSAYQTPAVIVLAASENVSSTYGGEVDLKTVLVGGTTLAVRWQVEGAAGHWFPGADATYDVGSSGKQVRFYYASSGVKVNNIQVLGAQQAHIADPSGGGTQDSQARTAINAILDVLDTHGLTAAA